MEERGQATLELALALPLVAMLLGVVVETGALVADRARLAHAAREAARVAVVDADLAKIRAAAREGGLAGISVSVRPDPRWRVQGEPLTVELAYHPPGRVPLLGLLFNRLQLTSAATMRIEIP